MHRTRIKICGLTRAEDVAAAVAAGADACGFIFAPSPRQVSAEQVAELAALVPPPVARVGVFVDAPVAEVNAAVERCGLTHVQLSGAEAPAYCDEVRAPVVKVMHVAAGFSWADAEPYRGHADALLLDTHVPGMAGGTSRAFDWAALGERPAWPVLWLAGGLHEHNVGEGIAALRPFAVDVSSSVEAAPGVKDRARIEAFCAAVRAADGEGSG